MSTYYAILTAVGEAKLANATALGTVLQLSKMAVGDGNGALPNPVRTQTALVRETYRADLNTLSVDPVNASQIIAELVIPETEGGYWLREMGIYDAAGDLFAVANCPPSYKPQMAEGSGRTQVLRMVLIVSSTAAVQLKIDPSVVLATRDYVVTTVTALLADSNPVMAGAASPGAAAKAARSDHRHPTDTTRAPLASPGFTGTPTAPTAAAGTNTTQLATTGFVQVAIAAIATATEVLKGLLRVGTQAEVEAGALDDVAVTPKKMKFGFTYSFGVNGYFFLPSWLMGVGIQWGSVTGSFNVTAAAAFPVAFPNQCFSCWPTWMDALTTGNAEYVQVHKDFTQTGFKAVTYTDIAPGNTLGTVNFGYLAIGR